jgi:hypothetical protein
MRQVEESTEGAVEKIEQGVSDFLSGQFPNVNFGVDEFEEIRQWQIAADATGLEFYKNHSTTQESESGSTYNTHTTTTVNRAGESGSKNFFVIAHISVTTTAGGIAKIRLFQDGDTMLGEVADGLETPVATPHGFTYNFVKRVSLDNSSHSFEIQFASLAGTIYAENSSIVVLEESANAEYNDRTDELGTGSDTGYVDYLTLTFTPSVQDDYMFFWAGETKAEDERESDALGVRFTNTTDSVVFSEENHSELEDGGNNNKYFTVGGAAYELVQASSHTYKIQMDGEGVSDERYMRRAAIAAIPFGDFENVYTDSQTTKTFHTGTSFSDSNVVLSSQAVNAADHLIIAGMEMSNERDSYNGYWRLVSDDTNFTAHNMEDRDEDTGEYYINFAVHGKTFSTSGNKTFKIQGNSDTTSSLGDGCISKAYMIIAEIPVDLLTEITVSGIAYTDEDGNTLNSSGGDIKLVNSTTGDAFLDDTGTDGTGNWSITVTTVPSAGDDLVIWLDGATANGTLVLKYGAGCTGGHCTGLELYQDRVIIRNEHTGSVTNTDLKDCDSDSTTTGTECQDTEIGFASNGTDPYNLVVGAGRKLYIWTGDTFAPGGTVTTPASNNGADSNVEGDLLIQSGATLSMAANALSIGGDYVNYGTFSQSSGQDTTFTATASGFEITEIFLKMPSSAVPAAHGLSRIPRL